MTRLLLLLGQCPFDPTSGAAQSMRQAAELLASQGFAVKALATTACEGELPRPLPELLGEMGLRFRRRPATPSGSWILAQHEGVEHELLEVEPSWKHQWERRRGTAYQAAYEGLLRCWQPELVLTFGGDPSDEQRRRQAQAAGARVIFALHNLYYRQHPPAAVDSFLVPSQFLAERYRGVLAAPLQVLLPPVNPHQVVAPEQDPVAVCFLNPEPAKGGVLVAQLAERLGRERPDIPLLVAGGRAGASQLLALGRDLGYDLQRHANLLQVAPTTQVRDFWAPCRVLLMPSVVEEAAGRAAVEAMLNGGVPLAAARGGLPEMLGEAGQLLPAPPEGQGASGWAAPAALVETWWQALRRLFDDEAHFQRARRQALMRAEAFRPDVLGPAYAAAFRAVLAA